MTAAAGVRTDSLVDQIGDWFADRGDEIAASAGKIAFTVVLALVINYLLRRTIRRTVAKISATGGHERPSLDQPRAATVDPARALAGERRIQRTQALGSVLSSSVSIIVFTIAIVMILGQMGVSLGPILASAGIAGVALGFGAQNLIKDFLAGIFVVVEDQYGVGDVIDAGLATGTVEEVGLRITRLRDPNGVIWYVRNGEVVRVGNMTQGWAMATIDVMVAYDEDLGKVNSIIERVTDELAEDEKWKSKIVEKPQILGLESMAADAVT
ncbi:MAG TPA: mechanosensitive ion channel domain-containing protein, partial [Actinomycetes bacterium]|nr:mechanosensitive ion channel domain-containing protein [Actinomycetes bacterium]